MGNCFLEPTFGLFGTHGTRAAHVVYFVVTTLWAHAVAWQAIVRGSEGLQSVVAPLHCNALFGMTCMACIVSRRGRAGFLLGMVFLLLGQVAAVRSGTAIAGPHVECF